MLALPAAPAPLRAALMALTGRTADLLAQARPFADRIADARLAMEVGAIQNLAELLTRGLGVADPLSEKVHASKAQSAIVGALGATAALLRRFGPRKAAGGAS